MQLTKTDFIQHLKCLKLLWVPAEILPTVVGRMLRLAYDTLFWAQDLPVGGRQQPLLVVIDEAHRFVPEGIDTPAHRTGLMLVTQRPSEIDSGILPANLCTHVSIAPRGD